jgi:trans-cinnamate 4-monooxygenase
VHAWWIANNPKYWDQPEKFIQDCFLNANIEVRGSDFCFLPFGAGRWSCPGIIITIPLRSIVFGHLVQSFELLPPPGLKQVDATDIATHSTVVARPIWHDYYVDPPLKLLPPTCKNKMEAKVLPIFCKCHMRKA